nr:MAG TPA: hypothetical protein [Caudoviricetes sp.]
MTNLRQQTPLRLRRWMRGVRMVRFTLSLMLKISNCFLFI